jgi:hypothetical protein
MCTDLATNRAFHSSSPSLVSVLQDVVSEGGGSNSKAGFVDKAPNHNLVDK